MSGSGTFAITPETLVMAFLTVVAAVLPLILAVLAALLTSLHAGRLSLGDRCCQHRSRNAESK
jgi:hypothetical protein